MLSHYRGLTIICLFPLIILSIIVLHCLVFKVQFEILIYSASLLWRAVDLAWIFDSEWIFSDVAAYMCTQL